MKKRIINSVILLSIIIIFGIIVYRANFNRKKQNVVSVSATPLTSHVVLIDAGHGQPDSGAEGLYGTTEEAINLKITLILQKLIEQSGGIVYLTRSDENGIYSNSATTIKEKKVSDIHNRANIANNEDIEICVSIHLNKFEDSKYDGWQTFYQEKSEESKLLANFIQDNLNITISKENNRVPLVLKGIYLMDNVDKPTVTVECGFLSNETEAKLLQTEDYQNKIAWGIYRGIQEYFKKN